MTKRPYIQLSIEELGGLVALNVRSVAVLTKIKQELKERSTKKARLLHSQVDHLISELRSQAAPRQKAPGLSRPTMPHPGTATAAAVKHERRTPGNGLEVQNAAAGSQPKETEESGDQAKPSQVSRIRSPESALQTPAKWVPERTDTLKQTWTLSDPTPLRFEKALRLLIQDIKRRGAGAQTIALEDGNRLRLDGTEYSYRFAWNGDDELFEGASVEIIVAGRVTPGRIVSIRASELLIEAESDLGPTIKNCVLRIDNTAMLVALADRMAAIAGTHTSQRSTADHRPTKGSSGPGPAPDVDGTIPRDQRASRAPREAGPFNTEMADGVLKNSGPAEAPSVPVRKDILNGLNGAQEQAVRSALSLPISFLWGPPGTGKTKSLSAVMRALFEANCRSVVCSNTNQAVDQVLAALCRDLITIHIPSGSYGEKTKYQRPDQVEALREGWIVRVGAIDPTGPLKDWIDYVSLQGITARKTRDLQAKLAVLEKQASAIEIRILPARQTLQAYQDLDRAAAAEAGAGRTAKEAATNASSRQQALEQAETRIAELRRELNAFDEAGALRRVLMRKRQSIASDMSAVESALPEARDALRRAATALDTASATWRDASRSREVASAAIAGKDRAAAQRIVEEAEAELGPIRTSIADVRRQIEEIAKTVLTQAKIVGTTATKLFLTPQTFGTFSTVIIDEASMLIAPALYNAAGLATERVIISGDFRQLSPIVPTNESCIREEIGKDVFTLAGIQGDFDAKLTDLKRTTLLDEQYRMTDPICSLLSNPMYRGRLTTSPKRNGPATQAPAPFAGPLTIIDTSTLGPVAAKDARGSWCNLMAALTVRNICRHLVESGYAKDDKAVGAIVPYAGQRKLLERMLADAKLGVVTSGTVHRYQGDEKELIILDLVDGIGRRMPGPWYQADQPTEEGAKLFNVAISRAKEHLIVVGDLGWLDKRLPARSLLRQWLFQMQELGSVVDARSILSMWPVAEELRRYGKELSVDLDAARTGIFDEKDFLTVVQLDMARAARGIAIWSAFVTPQGVARITDLLRARIQAGVKVRCVVRPPEQNGTIGEDAWADGIHALEAAGVMVDVRASMHEKVVLIDDDTAWVGSLNLLSHSGHTREAMLRTEGRQTALGISAFLAADPSVTPERAAGVAYERENPSCDECGRRTRFVVARSGGRFWSCQPCGWTRDARTGRAGRRNTDQANAQTGPACPLCGKATRKRTSRRGEFWGCTGYPQCNGTVNPDGVDLKQGGKG